MKHHQPTNSERAARHKKKLGAIFGVFLTTLLLGLVFIGLWPKEYHGKAFIIVSPHEKTEVLSQVSTLQFGTRKFINKQVSLLRSEKFLNKFAGQSKLSQRWSVSHAKASARLKRNIKVKALSKQRIEISFTSDDPEECMEISTMLGKAYLTNWRSIHDDLFNELNASLKSDREKFKTSAGVKIATFQALTEQSNVKRADYEFAKKQLLDLKSKDKTIGEEVKALTLERAIVASAARFDNHSKDHTLIKSVNWKAGLGLSALLALFTASIVGGLLYIKSTPLPEFSGAVSSSNEITLVPSNREQYANTKPFEKLKQKILFQHPTPQGLTISMVPCHADEDTAGVASQLAKAFSTSGLPTLLIDGNLRNPRLHTFFNASQQPGFAELLAGEMELSESIIKTQEDNLWVLPSGPQQEGTDVLSLNSRSLLVDEFRSRFDVIIFSNAPILSGIAPLILIGESDLSFICTEHDYASSQLLKKTRKAITETGGSFGGLVLTRLDSKQFQTVSGQIEKALG